MIYLENNTSIQSIFIPRQEVNQTAFTRYATEQYVDNAIANETARTEETYAKIEDLSEYTKTEDFATINGSAITQGGNIVIEGGGSYSAGDNIKIENNVISVTGITVPTKLSELDNDEGFITENDIPTSNTAFTNDAGYITEDALSGYSTTEQMNSAIGDAVSGKADTTYVDNAVSGKVDTSAMTAYYTSGETNTAISNATSGLQETLVSGTNIKTINNQSLLGSGNIDIQGGSGATYTAGDNIKIENNVISVTGITVPTKLSELDNDEGFITNSDIQDFVTSGDVKTQIEGYGYITSDALSGYSTTEEMNTAIDNAVSGKVDTSALTSYYTSAQTETAISNATSGLASITYVDNSVSGKADSSSVALDIAAATAATTGWVENQGYLTGYTETDPVFMGSAASGITSQDISNWNSVTGLTIPTSNTAFTNDAGYITSDALSGYSTTEQMNTAIGNAVSGKVDTSAMTAYYTSGETDTQISNATSGLASETWVQNKGYITGYTESDPVFMASAASGITAQDISNWNAVTGLTIPTSNTAFTNDAGYITEDALSGYASTSALTEIDNHISDIEDVTSTALNNLNTRVNEISGNSVTSVDVKHIVKITQNDYDNLANNNQLDEYTLYIII